MTLAELGAKLREAREAKGMSVADVADRLKIPGRILHGVEEASERLPRTVYVHHFIKDYIKLMGFSAAQAAEWTSTLEGFENISRPVIAESQPFTSVKPSMLPVVLSALLKVAVTALLAFAVYTAYVHFFAGRDYEEVKQPEVTQAMPAPASKPAPEKSPAAPEWDAAKAQGKDAVKESVQDAAKPGVKPAPAPEAPAVQAAPVWDVPAQPAAQEEPAVTQAMPSASEDALPQSSASLVSQMMPSVVEEASPTQAVEQAEVPAPALLPEGLHHVEVIADGGECWMGFEPDGRKQQRFLRKGDSFTMSFRDSLEVKLGNISAVRVIYDGKELERSSSQRVVTLRVPPAE